MLKQKDDRINELTKKVHDWREHLTGMNKVKDSLEKEKVDLKESLSAELTNVTGEKDQVVALVEK